MLIEGLCANEHLLPTTNRYFRVKTVQQTVTFLLRIAGVQSILYKGLVNNCEEPVCSKYLHVLLIKNTVW